MRVAKAASDRLSSMGPITDREIKNAPVWTAGYKMTELGGLYLFVKPNGSKWRRLRYSIKGVQKQISMGVYPQVTLAQARAVCNEAKALIAKGIDPLEVRREEKSAKKVETAPDPERITFGDVAQEWFKKNEETWALGHVRTIRLRLNKYVLPFIPWHTVKGWNRQAYPENRPRQWQTPMRMYLKIWLYLNNWQQNRIFYW